MKKLFTVNLFLILMGIMNTAVAATYTDTYSVFDNAEAGKTLSWQFDITDNGFNPLTETISSASISLQFQDDVDTKSFDLLEFAKLDIGGTISPEWTVSTGFKQFSVASLVSLNSTGILDITLIITGGDFFFLGGTLTANSTPPAPTPAPSALFLMGSGLIGIATATRRKRKKA